MSERDREYGRASLEILKTSLSLAEGGQPEFYRVAAAQLRLLVCDTTRRHGRVVDISLARRLWPELRLPPLDIFATPPDKPALLLDDWLAQSISLDRISLRRLIRLVCDQDGGVHVDPRPDAGLPDGLDAAGIILSAARAVVSTIGKADFDR